MRLVLRNARIWDGLDDDYLGLRDVLCVGGEIAEIEPARPGVADSELDLGGRALLPGFIDAHFHAYAASVNVPWVESLPTSYLAHHAAKLLGDSLDRGFTTVRDAGGADWGPLARPGGGPDPRPAPVLRRTSPLPNRRPRRQPIGLARALRVPTRRKPSEVVDGVDALRRADRETLRRGAHQIKIFVSGGVASPTDPIWMPQFSHEEILAVVDEAARRRTYVMAHAYGADAIIRAVRAGVRSIEHGNLLDAEAAVAMAEAGAFLVPTLVTYDAMNREGAALGLSAESQAKLVDVLGRGAETVRLARAAGVRIGLGTDLLGPLHRHQLEEFRLRGEVDSPLEVLRSATTVNAALLQREGRLGCVRIGAAADFVVFDGNPLRSLATIDRGPWAVVKRGTRCPSSRGLIAMSTETENRKWSARPTMFRSLQDGR